MLRIFFSLCVISLFITSCKKDSINGRNALSSVTIVNAINGSSPIVTMFGSQSQKGDGVSDFQFRTANQIGYGNFYESSSYLDNTRLTISQISDTFNILWSGNIDLERRFMYSLLFCGDTTKVDTLFLQDNNVPYYTYGGDSVAGVRFINLVQGSLPITVNIQGNIPSQFEFAGVSYKSATSFKTYPVTSAVPGYYIFEIRDASTQTLLNVYQWNYTVFRCQTIILSGSESNPASYPVSAFQYNNF